MPNPFSTSSTEWAVRYVGDAAFKVPIGLKVFKHGLKALKYGLKLKNLFGVGPAVTGALFELKNLATSTGESQMLFFLGAGAQAGFGRTAATLDPSWVIFQTERPYTFADFEGGARLGNLSLSIGVGGSLISFLVFNGIDVAQAWWNGESLNVSGLVGGTNLNLSYFPLGMTKLVGSDEIVETDLDLLESMPAPDAGAYMVEVLPENMPTPDATAYMVDVGAGILSPPVCGEQSHEAAASGHSTYVGHLVTEESVTHDLRLPADHDGSTSPPAEAPGHQVTVDPAKEPPSESSPAETCWQPQAGDGGNAPNTHHPQPDYDPMGDMVGPNGGHQF